MHKSGKTGSETNERPEKKVYDVHDAEELITEPNSCLG